MQSFGAPGGFGATTGGAFGGGAVGASTGGAFGAPSGFGAPAGGGFGGGDLPLAFTAYSEFARMVRCPADVVVVGSCNYDQIVYVPHFPGAGATIYGTAYATGFGGKGWTFVSEVRSNNKFIYLRQAMHISLTSEASDTKVQTRW